MQKTAAALSYMLSQQRAIVKIFFPKKQKYGVLLLNFLIPYMGSLQSPCIKVIPLQQQPRSLVDLRATPQIKIEKSPFFFIPSTLRFRSKEELFSLPERSGSKKEVPPLVPLRACLKSYQREIFTVPSPHFPSYFKTASSFWARRLPVLWKGEPFLPLKQILICDCVILTTTMRTSFVSLFLEQTLTMHNSVGFVSENVS